MIGEKMRKVLNEQVKYELESAYLYLSMAAYFQSKGFDGMAQWMRVQSMEEMAHAMKFFDHITERDGRVELLPLGISKTEWPSPLEAFQDAYKHEQFISSKINDLMKLAREEIDFAAEPLLHWFVNEQIEEEASTSKVVQVLERAGNDPSGLFMVDRDLKTRNFKMPPQDKET